MSSECSDKLSDLELILLCINLPANEECAVDLWNKRVEDAPEKDSEVQGYITDENY